MQTTQAKRFEFIGNLTKNAEHRICKNGNPMTFFCIAYKNTQTERTQQKTNYAVSFQNVLVFGDLTMRADKLVKGEFVKVQGELKNFQSGNNYVLIADSLISLYRPENRKKFDIDELSKLQ